MHTSPQAWNETVTILQERREKYRQTEREKEDAKLRQMKQTQREKVS